MIIRLIDGVRNKEMINTTNHKNSNSTVCQWWMRLETSTSEMKLPAGCILKGKLLVENEFYVLGVEISLRYHLFFDTLRTWPLINIISIVQQMEEW